MLLDSKILERVVSEEIGLDFVAEFRVENNDHLLYLLHLREESKEHTFCIRTTIAWRRIQIEFEAGNFAGDLLRQMGDADRDSQVLFRSILADCQSRGASINFQVNGNSYRFDDEKVWLGNWNNLTLSINKGDLERGVDDSRLDRDTICGWTGRFTAAVVSILPVEEQNQETNLDVVGYPEGALVKVLTNRYERDRRNRAAAIAIHGTTCKGCGLNMSERYGTVAEGFVEIHHTTPVSKLGLGYTINPADDLVPLCPNCHSIAHRRNPPLTVEEIQSLLAHD